MNSRWILAIAACLPLLLPNAAADPDRQPAPSLGQVLSDSYRLGHLVISVGPRSSGVDWTGVELGDNGTMYLRGLIDGIEDGHEDDTVSPSEVEVAEGILSRLVERSFHQVSHDRKVSKMIVMDDDVPISDVHIQFDSQGLPGPIDAEEHARLSMEGGVEFQTNLADVHTLQISAGDFHLSDHQVDKAEKALRDFRLTIEPQTGWTIDPDSIQPECAADRFDPESGKIEFTAADADCFQERGGDLIALSIHGRDRGHGLGGAFAPGWEVALALAALVGVVAMRRR